MAIIRANEIDCTPIRAVSERTIAAIQAWIDEDDGDSEGEDLAEPAWMAMFIEDDDTPLIQVEHEAFLQLDNPETHVQFKFCAQAGDKDATIAIQPV